MFVRDGAVVASLPAGPVQPGGVVGVGRTPRWPTSRATALRRFIAVRFLPSGGVDRPLPCAAGSRYLISLHNRCKLR